MKIKLNQIAITLSAAVAFTACKTTNSRLVGMDNIHTSRATMQSLTPLAPRGMVYVPAGTIVEKEDNKDTSVVKTAPKVVTVSAFFMDQTEVTNKQYRTFVDWVADSVVVTDYLKDEKYFQKVKKAPVAKLAKSKAKVAEVGAPMFIDSTKRIDWTKVGNMREPLWKTADPAIKGLLYGKLYTMINGKPSLIPGAVVYRYDRSSVDRNGASKYITDTVSVVPTAKVWSNDFPNSQMEVMDNNYSTNIGYDEYPIVGVNWKQARAYTNWRSKMINATTSEVSLVRMYNLQYNLPTEAQWEYAASKDMKPDDFDKLSTVNIKTREGRKTKKEAALGVNFKQQEGDYRKDGGTYTMHVKSYAPNSLGLYNMMGNVAEWTLDAFSPSYRELVHDLNPVLLYDAADTESEAMRRKVVRGGSWKDNADLLTPSTRAYEIQNVGHSYIGFRCVMQAPDVVLEQTKTRKQ